MMCIIIAVALIGIALVGAVGFYFLWREWRQRAEEHKRRIREITDDYMREREK